MRMTFKAAMMKGWTLTDDTIYLGSKAIKLTEITNVRDDGGPANALQNGVFQIAIGSKVHLLVYPYKQRFEAAQAIAYIRKNYGSPLTKVVNQAMEVLETMETRMRCNVCGKIYCYTRRDLQQNMENIEKARSSANMGLLNAIAGSELGVHANLNNSDKYLNRVVDYSKCPNCHSSNVSPIDESEDASPPSPAPTAPTAAYSVADELKKFKELLDMGIITQEEFDTQKKLLLSYTMPVVENSRQQSKPIEMPLKAAALTEDALTPKQDPKPITAQKKSTDTKSNKPKGLYEHLNYALQYSTDEGMISHLTYICEKLSANEQEELKLLMTTPQVKLRATINEYIESKQATLPAEDKIIKK